MQATLNQGHPSNQDTFDWSKGWLDWRESTDVVKIHS